MDAEWDNLPYGRCVDRAIDVRKKLAATHRVFQYQWGFQIVNIEYQQEHIIDILIVTIYYTGQLFLVTAMNEAFAGERWTAVVAGTVRFW